MKTIALILVPLLAAALPGLAQVNTIKRIKPVTTQAPVAPARSGIIVQGGLETRPTEAIGPKQDDPLTHGCGPGMTPIDGPVDLVRPGGEGDPQARGNGVESIGPKQDDPSRPGTLAIGPKQDDPSRPGVLAIGPKQDDPSRPGTLAIGPKQDDPRAPGAAGRVGRPGDDNDPKARCVPAAR